MFHNSSIIISEIIYVFDFITGNYTSFMSAAAKLAEKMLAAKGKACPTAYAIGGLGSLARGEVSPFSDLDFILLVQEDTPVGVPVEGDAHVRSCCLDELPECP